MNATRLFATTLVVLLLLPLVLTGCRSKKETVRIEQKVDTVRVSDVTLKQPDIFYNLTFDEICDTVTGEIRPINNIIVKSGDTLRLWTENNQLSLQIDLLERIVSQQRDSIQKSSSVNIEKDTVTKYRFHWWYWPALIASILVAVYFSPLGKWLKRILPFLS